MKIGDRGFENRVKAALSLVVVILAGCSTNSTQATTPATSQPPSGHTLTGTVSFPGFDPADLGSASYSGSPGMVCVASKGYDDLQAGNEITVKDGSGTIIATATLQQAPVQNPGNKPLQGRCVFPFSTSVPDVAFYQVSAGHRNPLPYSRADLTADSWRISLTIG